MPLTLTYRERSLYASLAAELVIYVPYFLLNRANSSVSKIAGTIFSIIVMQIALQSLIAAFSRTRVTDEQDRLAELRGYRAGYLTVISLIFIGLAALWTHATLGAFRWDSRFLALHFLNLIFCFVVISDVTKNVTQILAYRRAL